jgi:hypothetical protein
MFQLPGVAVEDEETGGVPPGEGVLGDLVGREGIVKFEEVHGGV